MASLSRVVRNYLFDEFRGGCFGSPIPERDGVEMIRHANAGLQFGQFFKRVGVESVQIGIH